MPPFLLYPGVTAVAFIPSPPRTQPLLRRPIAVLRGPRHGPFALLLLLLLRQQRLSSSSFSAMTSSSQNNLLLHMLFKSQPFCSLLHLLHLSGIVLPSQLQEFRRSSVRFSSIISPAHSCIQSPRFTPSMDLLTIDALSPLFSHSLCTLLKYSASCMPSIQNGSSRPTPFFDFSSDVEPRCINRAALKRME